MPAAQKPVAVQPEQQVSTEILPIRCPEEALEPGCLVIEIAD
jgi:hypothetical protein